MANRKLYTLELNDNAIIVYRTDSNYGRQGVIFSDGAVRKEYAPYAIPKYIIREALAIMAASPSELARGYTNTGIPCTALTGIE